MAHVHGSETVVNATPARSYYHKLCIKAKLLLDGVLTGAKRQVEIKAFALWHQIKRVAVNGETPEIGQNTLLKWVGGSGNTYMEPLQLLIDLEAIDQYEEGKKYKVRNPNETGVAAKYKRMV
ncbi:MAG: hypothetical protein ACON5C_00060 [Alphaproteobacteria bacterium]